MKKTLLFLLFFLRFISLSAQNPAEIEHNFGTIPGFDDEVKCILIQSDGKIIMAGKFSSYNGNSNIKQIVRLNPDGSIDYSFNYIREGEYYEILSIALQSDGKILVGGTNYLAEKRLIRLNVDGSKDNTFDVGSNFIVKNRVSSISIQPDGKILAAGDYLIARLNSDGSNDASFNLGTGFDNKISSIALQQDGKIVAGGSFNKFKGINQNYLIRLNSDGSKDSTFDIGTGFTGFVNTIIIQPDGRIIVGGRFGTYQGSSQNRLIRLNTNGSKDSSFVVDNYRDVNDSTGVTSLALQSNGKIVVGYGGSGNSDKSAVLQYLNPDGTKDQNFIGTRFNHDIYSVAILNDGKILVGGKFRGWRNNIQYYNIQYYMVCLNADATKDMTFNKETGFDGIILCSALQKDGKILIGGYFNNYKGILQRNLIRLNSDGSIDNSFNLQYKFNNSITSIILQPDGKILVMGSFTYYDNNNYNTSKQYLIRLNPNGSLDTSFAKRFDYEVSAIALQADGKILVHTYQDNFPNLPKNKLYRLNQDGTQDQSFLTGTDFNNVAYSIVEQSDGKILVGGQFTSFQGTTQNRLIRLNTDGSKDNSFNIGTGFDASVRCITLQDDGKILVGGDFDNFKEIPQVNLIRLNKDGSKDESFDLGIGFGHLPRSSYSLGVKSIVLQKDKKIIVGGEFQSYKESVQNRLILLNTDGSKDNSFDIGTGFNAPIETIALYSDGKILLGGWFLSYKDQLSSNLIRLKGTEVVLSNEDFITENKSFSVWPNPVKNTLNINSLNESNYSVKIYDLLGRLIYTKENVNTSIDVSSFTSGLYLIKIKAENGEASQKFIKI